MSGIFENLLSELQQLRREVAEIKATVNGKPDDLLSRDEICKELGISTTTFYKQYAHRPDVVRVGRQYKMRRSAVQTLTK